MTAQEQLIQDMEDAALTLYLAGCWRREGADPDEDREMWAKFADAMGIPAGTASALGVGSNPELGRETIIP